MGRYYSGDIEGKFWFAVQTSDDAEYFGAIKMFHNTIPYCVNSADLPYAKEKLQDCYDELGENKQRLDEFFAKGNGWNDHLIMQHFKTEYNIDLTRNELHQILEVYARIELGEKIIDYLEKHPGEDCYFEAEY